MNVSSAAAAICGRTSGSTTDRSVRHRPAPSDAAASVIDASTRARPARVKR